MFHNSERVAPKLSVPTETITAVDPLWIGVIGTGVGALATGLPNLGSAVVQSITARGQRKHDAAESKAKRDADAIEAKEKREHEETTRRRQLAADLLEQRVATIADWRNKLRNANIEYETYQTSTQISPTPNVAGRQWFETLRVQLSDDAEKYRNALELEIDDVTLRDLSLEIGRIEREWIAEAQG